MLKIDIETYEKCGGTSINKILIIEKAAAQCGLKGAISTPGCGRALPIAPQYQRAILRDTFIDNDNAWTR